MQEIKELEELIDLFEDNINKLKESNEKKQLLINVLEEEIELFLNNNQS